MMASLKLLVAATDCLDPLRVIEMDEDGELTVER